MAKKKKPAANPARGFATTSIASKAKVEKASDDTAAPPASPQKEPGKPSDMDASGPQISEKEVSTAPKQLHELSPEEMERQLERDELQLQVEQNGVKVRREAARQVSRALTDCRVLRSQAQSLNVKDWLSYPVIQQILALAKEDSQHDPQITSQGNEDAFTEDEMTIKLWTLREALSGFGIAYEHVDSALKTAMQKRLNYGDGPYLWGFPQSLEFLALISGNDILPAFDRQKVAVSQTQTPVDSDTETHTARQRPSPWMKMSVASDVASKTPSIASTEPTSTPDVSDVDSDLEPDELIPVYISLRVKLFLLQPDMNDQISSSKGKAKKQNLVASRSPLSPAAVKIQRQLAKIESDVLFDKREADAQWIARRNQLSRAASLRRKLDLPDPKAHLLDPLNDSSNVSSDAEAIGKEVGESNQGSANSDEEDLIGGMFLESGDTPNSTIEEDSTGNGTTVTLRDFGKFTGMSPRRIFEEACRARDSGSSISYKLVSPTTYSSRHSLTVFWTKAQDPAIQVNDVEVTQSSNWAKFTMVSIAASNPQQSEAFISVAALFALFSQSLKEEKVYMRLPVVWRDVWQEFATAEKERRDASDRQTIKNFRELIQTQRKNEEDEGIVLPHQLRTKRNGEQAKMTPSYQGDVQASEELQRTWSQRVSSPSYQHMLPVRSSLPIFGYRQEILAAIEANQVIILCGETGCGKSTQLPAYVLENELSKGNPCKIYCTEPRRISAISLAQRVSEELGEAKNEVGTGRSLIGYAIRLESHVGAATRLVYATVGIVLRMLESEQGLSDITHLVIDEVHERSIDTDFLLIIVKAMLTRRPKLRVILMSATVDALRFSTYLDGAPILTVPGRTFPVRTMYLEDAIELTKLTENGKEQQENDEDAELPEDDMKESKAALLESLQSYSASTRHTLSSTYDEYRIDFELIVRLIEEVASRADFNHFSKAFLVFLPGIAEIRELADILQEHPAFGADWLIYPLHSTIASDEQQQAFLVPPPGVRKVVLATNIAETGITIPDVTCVIDTGKHKEMRFDERRQLSRLLQAFISRSNAKQRRGRAGRVQDGLCFHLFTKYRHDNLMSENQTPEMLRLSLQDLIMRVKICKLGDIEETLAQALDPPQPKNVRKAIEALVEVDALTPSEDLTPFGQQLAKLPLDANLGKLCLLSCICSCLDVALTIAALLSSKSPFVTPFGARARADAARLAFKQGDSDLLTAYNAYVSWKRSCTSAGQSEFQFCRKNFLSPQNLSGIEDLKAQLLNALIDTGCVRLSSEDRQALSRYRYASRHRSFVPVPAEYNLNSGNHNFVNSVIAWALYPKILIRDGKGWRNIANNQSVSLHPTSVNKGISNAKFLSYYSILQSSSRYYNAHSTSLAQDFPLVLLAGSADFRLHAGVIIVDGNRLKFTVNDWKTMMAVKFLRTRLKEIVAARLKAPSKPLGRRLERWMEVIQTIFDAREAIDKK
ncbi:ATP dependent RNA helicase-like protein [Rhizodiscina lignyota]|uniref:RNA helicase n=1 Tax=Rhizodiscina lignyota TaxID=1504668 RepID=A0A9P4M8T8_9PEZI|nr:ATP dependent RNA helicase-like protein [Rhizodiscina lignyota]